MTTEPRPTSARRTAPTTRDGAAPPVALTAGGPGPTVRGRRATPPALALLAAATLALAGCTAGAGPARSPSGTPGGSSSAAIAPGDSSSAAPAPAGSSATAFADPALRDLADDRLLVGVAAAGGGHHEDDPIVADEAYRALVAAQFSSVTPENQMKWESIHPGRDTYDFAPGDAVVEFAAANGQAVRGHTLLWHQQNPAWLTALADDASEEELRQVLHDHVSTVVGHYAGRVAAWDVANEIFDDDGELRTGDNPFLARLGVDAVADAFRWAHEADPDAVLYLNDYNVEWPGAKRQAYLDLAADLLADGVPLGGFGVQGHLSLAYPFPSGFQDTLAAFAGLGLDVAITELDVRIPLDGAEPTDDQLDEQAGYYGQAVAACLAVPRCVDVTVWGVPDANSWVPSAFPDEGAATPFADLATPKPAFYAMVDALGD